MLFADIKKMMVIAVFTYTCPALGMDWFAGKIGYAPETEVTNIKEELENNKKTIQNQQYDIDEKNTKINILIIGQKNDNSTINELNFSLENHNTQIKKLDNDLKAANEKSSNLEKDKTSLENTNTDLTNKNSQLDKDLKTANNINETFKQKNTTLSKSLIVETVVGSIIIAGLTTALIDSYNGQYIKNTVCALYNKTTAFVSSTLKRYSRKK